MEDFSEFDQLDFDQFSDYYSKRYKVNLDFSIIPSPIRPGAVRVCDPRIPQGSPITRNLDRMVQSSAKASEIRSSLDQLGSDHPS